MDPRYFLITRKWSSWIQMRLMPHSLFHCLPGNWEKLKEKFVNYGKLENVLHWDLWLCLLFAVTHFIIRVMGMYFVLVSHFPRLNSLSISDDGTLVAGGFADSYIKIWSLSEASRVPQKNTRNDMRSGLFLRVSHSHRRTSARCVSAFDWTFWSRLLYQIQFRQPIHDLWL